MQKYRIFTEKPRAVNTVRVFILSLVFAMSVNIAGAQTNQPVKITDERTTVGVVMKSIETQTELKFYYDDTLDSNHQVYIPKSATTLSAVMDAVLSGTGFTYSILDQIIAIHAPKLVEAKPVAVKPDAPDVPDTPDTPVEQVNPQEIRQKQIPTVTSIIEVEPDAVVIPAPVGGYAVASMFGGTPRFAIKTNLLMDATASLALGVELKISQKFTVDISGAGRFFDFNKNKRFRHWYVQPEFRFWPCEAFNGHFIGLHAQFAQYNIGGLPAPFSKTMQTDRFEGHLYGVGISYGYQWILGKRWGIEATIGAGWNYLDYEQFPCTDCGLRIGSYTKNYFGITKAGVSLIYIIK